MSSSVWYISISKKKIEFKKYPSKQKNKKTVKKSNQKSTNSAKKLLINLILALSLIFFLSVVSAAEINDTFHINLQTTYSNGTIETGTFTFAFNITDNSSTLCGPDIVYNHSISLATDTRGIVSIYLPTTGSDGGDLSTLDFDKQYYLCYYRDGTLKDVSQLGRVPYAFRATQVNLSEISVDSNLTLGSYNVSASSGFFSFLGSLVERITKIFATDVDISNNLSVGGNVSVTGNVTADWFIGDINASDVQNTPWITDYTETDPYWTGNQSSYSTTAEILAFGYYNASDFIITDYFTKSDILGFGYYNLTNFDIVDYFTSAEVLAFNYYNASDFDIADYFTSAQILGFNYYNSSDFVISDYYTKLEIDSFDFYNLSDFDIDNYYNITQTQEYGNATYIKQSEEANLDVNSSTWWAGLTGWISGWFIESSDQLDFNETQLNETIDTRISGAESGLHVNMSDYWNTGDRGALRDVIQIQGSWITNDLAWINFTDGDGKYILLTEEGNLNVNRSEWWRTTEGDLDNVEDILGSWLTNDLAWINFTEGDTKYLLITNESNLNVNASNYWITDEGVKENVVDILGSEITNDLGWLNATTLAAAETDPYWTGNQSSYFNTTQILAFGYYNATNFVITDYFTKTEVLGFGYYNETDFNITDYFTKTEVLTFNYYNATDFNITDYFTKLEILGFDYYNATDFNITDYFTKSEVLGFGYYNLTDFDIDDYFNGTQILDFNYYNNTNFPYTHLSNFTDDILWTSEFNATADARYVEVEGDTMTGSLAINANLTIGTNALFVDSNNNVVGIGTVTPQNTLNVVGDINATTNIYGNLIFQAGNEVLDTSTMFDGDVSGTYNVLQLGTGVVGTINLANGSVTAVKIAPNAVNTTHIVDGTILDEDIATAAGIQWSKLSNYPYVIAGAGLTGGGQLSENRTISISFGDDFLGWTNLTDYPEACNVNETITVIGNTITCSPISIIESQISDFGDYVPTTRTITAGAGLTGGGNLSADRSFAVAFSDTFLGWTNLTDYPEECPEGQAVRVIGDTLTCINISSQGSETLDGYDSTFFMPLNTSVYGDFDFTGSIDVDGGWTSGGVTIDGGNLYAQTVYVYNITSLDVTEQNLTIVDDLIVYGNTELKKNLTVDTDTLFVDSNLNRVGIGTTSPQTLLDVKSAGTGSVTTSVFFRDSSTYGNTLMFRNLDGESRIYSTWVDSGVDSDLAFFTTQAGGTQQEGMRILGSNGNVGIGTTSPGTPLHIDGGITTNTTLQRWQHSNADDGNITILQYLDQSGASTWYISALNLVDATHKADFSIGTRGGSTADFVVQDGGNVGIGTVGPEHQLHLSGMAQSTDANNSNTGSQFAVESTVADVGFYYRQRGNSAGISGITYAHQLMTRGGNAAELYTSAPVLVFGTNDVEQVRIDGSGNVGIGDTTPESKLKITNPDTASQLIALKIQQDEPAAAAMWIDSVDYGILITGDDTAQSVYLLKVQGNSGSTEALYVGSDGKVGIGTTSPIAYEATTTRLHVDGGGAAGSISEVARFEGASDAEDSAGIIRLGTSNDWGIFIEGGRDASGGYGKIGITDYQGDKTESVYIQDSGNVGIGTTTPSTKLHVNGSAVINGTLNMDSNKIISLGNGTSAQDAVTLSQLQSVNASAGFDKGNIVQGTGMSLSGTLTERLVGSGDVTFNLANTAVTPGSYGGDIVVGTFTADQQGRITSASNQTIRTATTSVSGITTLTASVATDTNTTAATPWGVKVAYDTATAKASPGTCPAGQVVQNTTTGGVQCVADQDTTYTASGTLLNLTGTTFSVNEGTLTDAKGCKFVTGTGIVCDQDYLTSFTETDPLWTANQSSYYNKTYVYNVTEIDAFSLSHWTDDLGDRGYTHLTNFTDDILWTTGFNATGDSRWLTSYTETDPLWTGNFSVRTGTGNVVYSTSPTLVTPNIGAATAGGTLNMDSNKIISLANGTNAQDAVALSQLQTVNTSATAPETDPLWTANQSSYSTTAEILAFGYYNASDFVITDYFTKSDILGFGYYNLTDFDIADYFTSLEVLAFNYYNLSDFDIADYFTSAQILGFNYYNSSDFVISDYYTKTEIDGFGFYNLSDFDIEDYYTKTQVYNKTEVDDFSLSKWTDDLGDRGYTHLTNFTDDILWTVGFNATGDARWLGVGEESDPLWTGNFSSKTGTGNVVYSTSPTLVTPNIGAATAGGTLDMNSNKIISLGNGTSAQDAVTLSQLQTVNTSATTPETDPYWGANYSNVAFINKANTFGTFNQTFDTNTLFIDSVNDRVGIGTASPTYELDVVGNIGMDEYLYHNGDADTYYRFLANRHFVTVGGVNMLDFTPTAFSIDGGGVANTQIGGGNFFVGGSGGSYDGNVGIGTASPNRLLTLKGKSDVYDLIQFINDGTGTTSTDGFQIGHVSYNSSDAEVWNREDGYLRFATNNTERIRILAGGNVGIGTTSPGLPLSVVGNIGITTGNLYIITSGYSLVLGGDSTYGLIKGSASKDIRFDTNSSEQMRILANGNVGIGTTTPGAKLHVKDASATWSSGNNETVRIGNTGDDTALYFGTKTNDYAWIDVWDASIVRDLLINPSGGNVGIGTTSPGDRLVVKNSGTSGDGIKIQHSTGTEIIDIGGEADGDGYMYIKNGTGTNKILLYSAGDSYFTGGSVGIGTTTPDYTLDVAGNIGIDAVIYHNGDADTYIQLTSNRVNFYAGAVRYLDLAGGEVVVNEGSADVDFRVESNADTHALFVQGSDGKVGIGTTTPQQKLHVNGSAVINGTLNLDSNQIISLANGTSAQDAVALSQLQAVNASATAPETDPYWTANQSSYSTTAEILAFGYYNASDFVITDYFTKTDILGFGYYNLTDFDIADYFTSAEVLAFNYYNASDFDIADYFTSAQILGFNYYNSSDFVISDYYTKTEIDGFGFYNLSDFDIEDYYTKTQVYNKTEVDGFSLSKWIDDLGNRGYTHLTNFTDDILWTSGFNATGDSRWLTSYTETDPKWTANYSAKTGTGNVVFSASPTFTGTVGAAAITASGIVTASGGNSGNWNTAYTHVSTDVIELATDVQGVSVGGDLSGTVGSASVDNNKCTTDQVLEGDGTCVTNYEAGDDGDADATNEYPLAGNDIDVSTRTVTLETILDYVTAINSITNIYDDAGASPWLEVSSCGANTGVNSVSAAGTITCVADSASDNYGSWTLAGDSGTETVSSGQTAKIAGSGTIDTIESGTRTVVVSVQADSIDDAQIVNNGIEAGSLAAGSVTVAGGELDAGYAGTGIGGGGASALSFAAADVDGTCLTGSGTTLSVTGNCIGNTQLEFDTGQALTTGSTPTFSRLTLSQATGTAPLTVSSTTLVSNLNADLLDGLSSVSFARMDGASVSESASSLAVGWYTVAVNGGDRAIARFGLRDIASGKHQSALFYASHHFGAHSEITVYNSGRYSGTPFRYIRIKEGGTYDGALLQIYVDDASNSLAFYILGDNFQTSGWVIKDFVPDGTDPGGVGNFTALTNVAAQVDLDQIMDGGIVTTGPIYAGDDTTQYNVWHAGNDGTGSGLDADKLDGSEKTAFQMDVSDSCSGENVIQTIAQDGTTGCYNTYSASDDLIDDITEWQGQCTNCVTDGDVVDTLTASNYVRKNTWTDIDNYPTGCGAGTAVRIIGDTLTCIDVYDAADDPISSIAEWQGLCTDCVGSTDVGANAVALTTDTTGNYAAGTAEAGAALTGDSATGFFSSGEIATAQTAAKCTSSTCNDAIYSGATFTSACSQCVGADEISGTACSTVCTDAVNDPVYSEGTIQSVCTDCIGDAQLLYNTGQHLTSTSTPSFNEIYVDIGAIGDPSYTWTGDTNTGLYWPAADQLGVTLGGVMRASFKANYFEVKPSTDSYGILVRDSGSSSYANLQNINGVTHLKDNTAAGLTISGTAVSVPDHGTGTTDMLSNVIYTSGLCASTGASTTTIGTICVEY